MCLEYLSLNNITSWVTIFGVIYASISYWSWKHNYKAQKAHDYSLEVLKKCKQLEFEIEELGSMKFVLNLSTEIENIRSKLTESLNPLLNKTRSDLFVAKYILIKHTDISKWFNSEFRKTVLYPIYAAFYEYNKMTGHRKHEELTVKEIKGSKVYKLFFCSDNDSLSYESALETGTEIVNNEFYRGVEKFFKITYAKLEDNLLIHSNTEPQNAQESTKSNNTNFGGMHPH